MARAGIVSRDTAYIQENGVAIDRATPSGLTGVCINSAFISTHSPETIVVKKPFRTTTYGMLIALSIVAITSLPSRAGVIVTGDLAIVSPPPSVVKGADTSLTNGIIFQEQSGFVLPSNISVDMTSPGTSNSSNSYTPSPGTVAVGFYTDVWFLHTDPTGSTPTTFTGTATFDTPILGVIDTLANLDATDPTLGHVGTLYPTGPGTSRSRQS